MFRKPIAIFVAIFLVGSPIASVTSAETKIETPKNNVNGDITVRAAKKKDRVSPPAPVDGQVQSQASEPEKSVLPELAIEQSEPIPTEGIAIEKIELRNQTIFSDEELRAMLSPYEKRLVHSDELQQLRNELSNRYFEKGYINSGVVIPDQKIENGIVVLQAIEGKLNTIEIVGNQHLKSEFIERSIRHRVGATLNVTLLQNSLKSFEHYPVIENIYAELVPGAQFGESRLLVNVKERRPYQFEFRVDNHRASSIGAEQARLSGRYFNLTGLGDEANLDLGITQGVKEYALRYSIPVTPQQIRLNFVHALANAEVVKSEFKKAEIHGQTQLYSISANIPVLNIASHSWSALTQFDVKQNETFAGDFPISLMPGADDDGKTRIRLLSAGGTYGYQRNRQMISIYTGVKTGLNVLNATVNENGPDAKFLAAQFQGQYLLGLKNGLGQLRTKFNSQYSFDDVLAFEKNSIGGINSVRGYIENQAMGDNGMNASIEWQIPLPKPRGIPFPVQYSVYPFIDNGFVWDNNHQVKSRYLVSTGLGLQGNIAKTVDVKMDWGYGFTQKDKADYGGFLMSLSYTYQ